MLENLHAILAGESLPHWTVLTWDVWEWSREREVIHAGNK